MYEPIIAAASGLLGAAIGGFATYKTASFQFDKEEQRISQDRKINRAEKIIEKLLILNRTQELLSQYLSNLKNTKNSEFPLLEQRVEQIFSDFNQDSAIIATWIEVYFEKEIGERWNTCLDGIGVCHTEVIRAKRLRDSSEIDWDIIEKNFNLGTEKIGKNPKEICKKLKTYIT